MNSFHVSFLNKLSIGLILLCKEQKIVLWNHWMEKKTELSASMVVGKEFSDICTQFGEQKYKRILDTVMETGHGRFLSGTLHGTFFQQSPYVGSKELIVQNLQIEQLVLDNENFLLIEVIDITSQYHKVHQMKSFIKNLEVENEGIRQAELAARTLAFHDALTGLPNRMYFMNRLSELLKDPNGNNGTAVIFLDVDDFKHVNDTYGHSAGDVLLQMTAQRLMTATENAGFVARIAGDEFTILLYEVYSKKLVEKVAQRILEQFCLPFEINGTQISVTCSFGISLFPSDGTDATSLIHKADTALYRVKREHKSGYRFYSDEN